jgi:hypothetical protein
VVGFYIDAANTRGYLHLSGGTAARNKAALYEVNPDKFLMKFLPLKNGMRLSSVGAIAYCDEAEESPHSMPLPDQYHRTNTHRKHASQPPYAGSGTDNTPAD